MLKDLMNKKSVAMLLAHHKVQIGIMLLITFYFLLGAMNIKNELLKFIAIALYLAAIVGIFSRKNWVKYCFFAVFAVAYLPALIIFMRSFKYGFDPMMGVGSASLFLFVCFASLPWLATAYLAQYFFDQQAIIRHDRSAHIVLAIGAAIATYILSQLVIGIMNIIPSVDVLFQHARQLRIPKDMMISFVSLPDTLLHLLISAAMILVIGLLSTVWKQWHSNVAAGFLFIFFSLYSAIGIHVSYFKGHFVARPWIFDGIEISIMPLVGMIVGILLGGFLTTKVKKWFSGVYRSASVAG